MRFQQTICAWEKIGRIRNGHNVTVSTQMTKQTFHQLVLILLTELCPSKEISGMTLSTTCHSDGSEIDCSGHLLPGTTATIYCHAGYVKPPSGVIRDLTCLPSGEWSHQVHQCLPNCGIASKSSNKLQIRGSFWFSFSLNFLSFFLQIISQAHALARGDLPEWHTNLWRNDHLGARCDQRRSLLLHGHEFYSCNRRGILQSGRWEGPAKSG